MNKKIITTMMIAFCLLFSIGYAESYFPNAVNEDKVSLELCNLSEIGTMTEKDASFKLVFESGENKTQTYNVEYKTDGKNEKKVDVQVNPAQNEKTFLLDVKNGIHTLSVIVSKNGAMIKSFEEKFTVMDLYERHFMDELSGRGINGAYELNDKEKSDLLMNYMKYSGWRKARGAEAAWMLTESKKGLYNFKDSKQKIDMLKSIGLKPYYLLNQGNGFLYPSNMTGINSWSNDNRTISWYLPQTKESLEGFANFAESSAEYMKSNGVNYWHIWNEGDLNGQASNMFSKAQCYSDMAKSAIIRTLYKGQNIESGLFVGVNDMNFYDYGYDAGLYPYSTTVDHHVYKSSGNDWGFSDKRYYEKELNNIEDVIIKHGGWKDKAMSETGYTTPKASGYPTEEEAAMNIAKNYAACELYDYASILPYNMVNSGTEETYTEHNFGQLNNDLTPKMSYPAIVAFNNFTEGGICIGELDFGDDNTTRAFVYYRDGKPIVMAWTWREDKSEVEWKPEGEKFDVYDYMGSKSESGVESISLSEAPVYLDGFSKNVIAQAVKFEIEKKSADWSERYADIVPDEINSSFSKEMMSIKNDLEKLPSAENVLGHMNALGGIADELLKNGKEGKMSELNVSQTVYGLYRMIQRLNGLYISVYDGDMISTASKASDNVEKKADELYRNDLKSMQFSDEIRRHAKRYSDNVKAILKMEDNPSKSGVLAGYTYMEELLCGWFDKFSEYESTINLGYQIQSSYYDRITYANSEVTTPYRVWNYSKKSFSGHIEVYDDKGNMIAKTKDFMLDGNGGYKEISVKINPKRPEDGSGLGFYDVRLVNNSGGVVSEQRTVYEVKDMFKVTSEASPVNVQNISSLPIKIENVMNVPATAHLKVESDENFKFVKTEYDVQIDANSSVTVDMPVTDFKETAFHFYSFKYEVSDDAGNVIVKDEKPLNFTTVVKAENPIDIASFDGDISSWSDAYPIYLNPPINLKDKESWATAECSSRVFLKWDEDNLYVLADIYDERLLQEYQGSSIWEGDSLQVSIDPLNDGALVTNNGLTKGYKSDDYELGFSYTANGNEFYCWQSPNGLQGGTVDWFKVLRDDSQNCTRYIIKIQGNMIEKLNLSEGFTFGFNVCINDADILGREGFYQFTKGTGDMKDPDQYADFTLSTAKSANYVDGLAAELFPMKIKSTIN